MNIYHWSIAAFLTFWINQLSGQTINPRYLQLDCDSCAPALYDIYRLIESDQLSEATDLINTTRARLSLLPYTAISEDILDSLLGLELAIEFNENSPDIFAGSDSITLEETPSSEFSSLLGAARFLYGLAPYSTKIFIDDDSKDNFVTSFFTLSNSLVYLWASENDLNISSLDLGSIQQLIALVEDEELSPAALNVLADIVQAWTISGEESKSHELQTLIKEFLINHEGELNALAEMGEANKAIMILYDVSKEVALDLYLNNKTNENLNEYILSSMELSNQFIKRVGERSSDWFRYQIGLNGRRDIFAIPRELTLEPEIEQLFSIGEFASYLYQYTDDIQNLALRAPMALQNDTEAQKELLELLFAKQLEQKTIYPSAVSFLQMYGVSKFIEDGGNIDQVLELSRLASEDLDYGKRHPLAIPMLQLTLSPTARVRDLLPYEVTTRYLDQAILLTTNYISEEPHPYLAYDELVRSQFYSILMTSFPNFDGDLRLLFSDLLTMWATVMEFPKVDSSDITRFAELTVQNLDGTTESSISNLNQVFALLNTSPEHYEANSGGSLSNAFHDGTDFSDLNQPLIRYVSREYLASIHHFQSDNYLTLAEETTGKKSETYLKLSQQHRDLAEAYYAPYPTIYFEPWNEGFSVERYKTGILIDSSRNIDPFYCDTSLKIATEMLRWRMNVDQGLTAADRDFLVQKSFEIYESALDSFPACGEVNSDQTVSLFNYGNVSYRLEKSIDNTTDIFKKAWSSFLDIDPGIRSYADDVDIELGARILVSLCAESYGSMNRANQAFCDSNLLSLVGFTTSGTYAGQLTQGIRIASSTLDTRERSALRDAFANQTTINDGIDSSDESMEVRNELASQRLFLQEQGLNANYVETNPISTNSDILNALSDGELLVTIFSTLNEKAAIALWNNTQSLISISLVEEEALSSLAQQVRNSVATPYNTRGELQAFNYDDSYELFKLLFSGKEAILERATYVTVMVDDLNLSSLNNLPLSILVGNDPSSRGFDQKSSWVFKDKLTRRLPTLNALVFLNDQNPGSLEKTFSFLGVGNPYLEQELLSQTRGITLSDDPSQLISNDYIYSLPSLPETARELLNIEKIVSDSSGRTTLLIGQDATESAFKAQALEDFDVLAFATHGVIPGEIPGLIESALVFSPDLERNDEDGLLYFSEIADLNLSADLVVLSTCNSARQDIDGLSTSFFIGGAQSVLATHWELDSKVAETYTTNFFKNYISGSGLSYAEALRDARDEISRTPGWEHPYFWAPFSLYGHTGEIAQSN